MQYLYWYSLVGKVICFIFSKHLNINVLSHFYPLATSMWHHGGNLLRTHDFLNNFRMDRYRTEELSVVLIYSVPLIVLYISEI